jgi:hypothetical protein
MSGQASSGSRIQPRRPQEPPRFVQGRTYPSKQSQVRDKKSARTAPRSDEDEEDEDDEDDTGSASPSDDSENDHVGEEDDDDDNDDNDEEESGDDVKRKDETPIFLPGRHREPQLA